MPNQRIKAITDTATLLFLQQGYSRTQISHIAKAAGVSVGTVYLDFSGKRAIMLLILKCMLEPEFIGRDLERPVTEELFQGIENEIADLFVRQEEKFASHLTDTAYGLEALISDAYDLLARYAAGILFIEKNQSDFPLLAEQYKGFRKKFFHTMEQYLLQFIKNGTVRPMEHPDLSAALIIELLTWWAMDRRYVSFELSDIPMQLAKKVCLDNIIPAYKQ